MTDARKKTGYNIVLLIRAALMWWFSVSSLQVLGRQCGAAGWPGEQVIVAAAARRYVRAAVKLAARGQFSKRDGEQCTCRGALSLSVFFSVVWLRLHMFSTCIVCHADGRHMLLCQAQMRLQQSSWGLQRAVLLSLC
jgi:hypothetical protein